MKYIENNIASFHCTESLVTSISKFCLMTKDYPHIIEPFNGGDERVKNILLKRHVAIESQIYEQSVYDGLNVKNDRLPNFTERIPLFSIDNFYIYPTVKKTTLFYDETTDCFFKILQPLTLKKKFFSLFIDRGRSIYNLSEKLLSEGVKVPRILAYGMFEKGRKFFYIMERIKGHSLHHLLIKEKKKFPIDVYLKVIEELAKLHHLGYWFGDLRISHIFINHSVISGFVDIDSIRRNIFFALKNVAKDLAGLNHPELPLKKEERQELFNYYVYRSRIKNAEGLLRLTRYYSERRWR